MRFITDIAGALRTAVLSILICCAVYTLLIWSIGQVFMPKSANGSLVQSVAGQYVGSRQIAQKFTADKYFHSRPSAAEYDGSASSGSNLSPNSPELKKRAEKIIKKYNADASKPLPLDMAAASGSGLDPHITLKAAEFQLARVAKARAMSKAELMKIVKAHIEYPGGIMRNEPIINVLILNLALDEHK